MRRQFEIVARVSVFLVGKGREGKGRKEREHVVIIKLEAHARTSTMNKRIDTRQLARMPTSRGR